MLRRSSNVIRAKSEFKDNITASLALQASKSEIRTIRNNHKSLLDLSKEHIKEHAARRVDLFFYTLVAYYKTQFRIVQGDTQYQHGLGRKTHKKVTLTQACHSSFFPAFVEKRNQNIISGTHFQDSLNSTVELPIFVNYFDGHLEGKIGSPSSCRKACIEIIQNVALGIMTPIDGLKEFFIVMTKAFDDMLEKKISSKSGEAYLDRHSQNSPVHIKTSLLELQKEGTFKNKWHAYTQEVSEEYIEMLMRLKPEEKSYCETSPKNRNDMYLKKMSDIQQEILTSKSSFVCKI